MEPAPWAENRKEADAVDKAGADAVAAPETGPLNRDPESVDRNPVAILKIQAGIRPNRTLAEMKMEEP
jgi:hypothetical protein